MHQHLAARTLACLRLNDPRTKCASVRELRGDWLRGVVEMAGNNEPVEIIDAPGRPEQPRLVPHQEVGRRSIHTRDGHAALIHALAHIEFNAINLALDAVYRFRGLPRGYYGDWLQVADEEARHFSLLREHLVTLGYDYGSFPAHDGLWQMCRRTAHDPLVRMALVPRLLEARGLDVNPAIARKLGNIGDTRGVEILDIILRDEIGHVRIGNRWYEALCDERGLDPLVTFRELLTRFDVPRPRPPFHTEARRAAGFGEAELASLAAGGGPAADLRDEAISD